MSSTLARPPKPNHNFKKVAILFAGGPAPAANAVISTCAVSFLRADVEVVGIKHGYSSLMEYTGETELVEGKDFIDINHTVLRRTRASQGILIGTARANPGKQISHPSHLNDEERSAPLRRTYEALISLGVDALVSIGGDDTLKTAVDSRAPRPRRRMVSKAPSANLLSSGLATEVVLRWRAMRDRIRGQLPPSHR